MKIVPQSVQLEFITPNADVLIEKATRVCYKSEDKIGEGTAAVLIKSIWEKQHHSCIEHAVATFRVICDRGVSHEFVRHRIMSFSQESTRYCNYGKGKFGGEITVIEPPGLYSKGYRAREIWVEAMEACEKAYLALLEDGKSPQIARSVLPTCLKTELVATANFREWLHFLKLRTAKAAHPQMREVAIMIGEILNRECHEVFGLQPMEALK